MDSAPDADTNDPNAIVDPWLRVWDDLGTFRVAGPDTVGGVTAVVLAPEHPLVDRLTVGSWPVGTDPRWTTGHRSPGEAIVALRRQAALLTDIERQAEGRQKTAVFTGSHAVNPATGGSVPVFAADHVLADYGTGAIMAVPGRDERDRELAEAVGLAIIDPVTPHAGPTIDERAVDEPAGEGGGRAIIDWLVEQGYGEPAVTYRLRDWLVSRQRYWGTPIPVVHCPACGEVPVPDDQLPVRLPVRGDQLRPGDGRSPLATNDAWVAVDCPRCGGAARRDTDTMDTFVDSSWYFLRHPDPDHDQGPFQPESVARWLPVDEYIGGREHATGHLIYARFLTKALHDLGLVDFTEPFTRLVNQGQVLMDGRAMSKTLGNLVDLQGQIDRYGPDAVRVTMLFAGPPEEDIDWATVSPAGSVRWLARVWRLAGDVGAGRTGEERHGDGHVGAGRSGDNPLRRSIHRLIGQVTRSMEARRLNVAIARLMELTTVVRRGLDAGTADEAAGRAVEEGADALVRMLSCFAPFTAEEAWRRLGNAPSVCDAGWPVADPALVAEGTVTCVIQVDGRVRDRIEVASDTDEATLRRLALASHRVRRLLAGDEPLRVVVRAPHLVNVVLGR